MNDSWVDRWFDSGWRFGLSLVLVFVLMSVTAAWVINNTSLPGQLAEIEQLRADVAVANPIEAEAVVGQVTKWNQTIRSKQVMNATWYAGWSIPDEWDHVALIVIAR